MALSAAEEESIEEIKKWWRDSGKNLFIGLVVIVLIYLGWQQWRNAQMNSAADASAIYQQLTATAGSAPGQLMSDTDRARAMQLADRLREEYSGSIYARYGALFAAKAAAEADELDVAQEHLEWVLENSEGGLFSDTDESLLVTARLRLGRVLLAKGEAQNALDAINGVDPGNYEAAFAELQGDIYVALGDTAAAQDSYRSAIQAGPGNPFLQMKLDNLSA